jgi:hypothetical protein
MFYKSLKSEIYGTELLGPESLKKYNIIVSSTWI